MNITKTAINTDGLWYGYVSVDGVCQFQSPTGFTNRQDAIADADAFLEVNADNLI